MEWAIVALIGVQTLILALVGIVVWRGVAKLSETTNLVQKAIRDIEPKIQAVLTDAQRFTKTVQPIGEQLVDISIDVKRIVEVTRRTSEEVAEYVEETTRTVRRQTTRIDGMITDTVKRAEYVVDVVTQSIIRPLQEVSLIFKGFRAAVGYLRGERPHRDRERFNDSDNMAL